MAEEDTPTNFCDGTAVDKLENYFDGAATEPMSEAALGEYVRVARASFGNPSSLHAFGVAAKRELERARETVASALGVEDGQIVFTSGASEGNSLVLEGALSGKKGVVVHSQMDHPSVLGTIGPLINSGWQERLIPLKAGSFQAESFASLLDDQTRLILSTAVDSLTGIAQPLCEMLKAKTHVAKNAHFHLDATQAIGRVMINTGDLCRAGLDTMSFSFHKFGGPKGVGVLWTKRPIKVLNPAGGQEGGMRGGTENVPGIVAGAASLCKAIGNMGSSWRKARELRGLLVDTLRENNVSFTPLEAPGTSEGNPCTSGGQIPHILALSLGGITSEVAARALSDMGFAVSSGSACHNLSKHKTNQYSQRGFDSKLAKGVIRITFNSYNTTDSTRSLALAIAKVCREFAT